MKEKSKSTTEEGLTRRSFMKGGAGAVIAASCLHNVRTSAAIFEAQVPKAAGANTYDGKLNAQETAIEGDWKQFGASAPLVLKRVKK
jgi:hypothetical protein